METARADGLRSATERMAEVLAWRLSPARRSFVRRLESERLLARQFDQRFGVDTWGEPSLTEVGVPADKAREGNGIYRGIWEGIFHEALRGLELPVGGLTFVDYGAGKGKALLLASAYPFRRIVGVEYAPGLHEVAQRNLSVFHSPTQQCFSLGVVGADALEWEPPAEPLLCFFFNPFSDEVMERVLARLAESWYRIPRDIYLLYVNIRNTEEQAQVFEQCSEVTLLRRDQHALLAKVTPNRVHAWRP
ncbi:MAG: class I SAM-dependent methyltransferase [Cystobacter sp.]